MNKLLFTVATFLSGSAFWLADRAVDDLPGRVDANGRLLRMRIEGQGSPTVILEIGIGGPLEEWDMVQSEVARFATVVAYDRIGAVETRSVLTGEEIAHELRAALRNAGIDPPYILCGQSLGGVYNRLFASLYPDEVAGMVLLDPTQEEFIDWMDIHHPKQKLNKKIMKNWAEGAGIWDTMDQVRVSAPLPDIPVIVVTGTKFIDDKLRIETLPMWTACHAKWVNALPQGRHVLATESGHGVQIEVPELVVDLIHDVVDGAASRPADGTPVPPTPASKRGVP
jgi:pimeloyl-ACP methyl ester carboxylesterase